MIIIVYSLLLSKLSFFQGFLYPIITVIVDRELSPLAAGLSGDQHNTVGPTGLNGCRGCILEHFNGLDVARVEKIGAGTAHGQSVDDVQGLGVPVGA